MISPATGKAFKSIEDASPEAAAFSVGTGNLKELLGWTRCETQEASAVGLVGKVTWSVVRNPCCRIKQTCISAAPLLIVVNSEEGR